MPVAPDRAPLAAEQARGGWALLIVDMISTWDFPDASRVAAGAVAIAPRIAALKKRCARAGVPTVYVNDNHGHWRSDFRELVAVSAKARGARGAGAAIAASLAPGEEDYSVLKPKHSAFFATPLDLLLRHLGASKLILTGVTTDQCILLSAVDARMRDYSVVVPDDCVAAQTAKRSARALEYLADVQTMKTTPSGRIRLPARLLRTRRPAQCAVPPISGAGRAR